MVRMRRRCAFLAPFLRSVTPVRGAPIRNTVSGPGVGRPVQDRAGQDRAGQDRAGQDRAGQDRAGQDRTGRRRSRVRAAGAARRRWLNTGGRGIGPGQLRGRIVLLDFWTAGCVNCLRVLDELAVLEQRHGDALVVLGVHSPKFPHEAQPEAVAAAVRRQDVRHPVLDDADLVTWDAYAVHAWPTLVLVDPRGYVVAQMTGEGHGRNSRRWWTNWWRSTETGCDAARCSPSSRARKATLLTRQDMKVAFLSSPTPTPAPTSPGRCGSRGRRSGWPTGRCSSPTPATTGSSSSPPTSTSSAGRSAVAAAGATAPARPPGSPSRSGSRCSLPRSPTPSATTWWWPTPATTRCAGCAWPTAR